MISLLSNYSKFLYQLESLGKTLACHFSFQLDKKLS
jgi:hypothetical protein